MADKRSDSIDYELAELLALSAGVDISLDDIDEAWLNSEYGREIEPQETF